VSFIYPDSAWRTDVPVRSIACVLEFAFRCGGVRRVEGRAADARELAPVHALGAVEEGTLRRSHLGTDGVGDQTLWSILDTEWETRGGGAAFGLVRMEGPDPSAGLPSERADAPPPAWTTRVPTLKGSLVTLREVGQLDVPVLLRALDPADLDIALAPAPRTSDSLRRYVAWVQLQRTVGRAVGFAIVPRGTRHAAGLIQVRRDDASGLIAEWGIILAARYRGTGVAVEATELMAAFAFDALGADRLEARASGIDPRSVGLLRKLGAVHEAHMRRSFIRGEEALDDDLWAILKDDWRRR
jgi:RimJ/RimL family protein N-acetyltransferase